MKIAIYPGTFDPITTGHIDIVKRAVKLFDQVYVLILDHNAKQTVFPLAQRKELAMASLQGIERVRVETHCGLTMDFAHKVGACALIRGIRQIKDYEYELNQAACNAKVDPQIETVVLFAKAEYAYISSSSVKDFAYYHQDVSGMVSEAVVAALLEKYR